MAKMVDERRDFAKSGYILMGLEEFVSKLQEAAQGLTHPSIEIDVDRDFGDMVAVIHVRGLRPETSEERKERLAMNKRFKEQEVLRTRVNKVLSDLQYSRKPLVIAGLKVLKSMNRFSLEDDKLMALLEALEAER